MACDTDSTRGCAVNWENENRDTYLALLCALLLLPGAPAAPFIIGIGIRRRARTKVDRLRFWRWRRDLRFNLTFLAFLLLSNSCKGTPIVHWVGGGTNVGRSLLVGFLLFLFFALLFLLLELLLQSNGLVSERLKE